MVALGVVVAVYICDGGRGVRGCVRCKGVSEVGCVYGGGSCDVWQASLSSVK